MPFFDLGPDKIFGKMAFESGFVLFYHIEIKRKIDVDISDSLDLVKLKDIWYLTLSKII